MSFKFTCSHCESTIKLKDTMEGKRGRCPVCGESIKATRPLAVPVVQAAPVMVRPAPIAVAPVQVQLPPQIISPAVQTTQITSKFWKLLQMLNFAALLIGITMLGIGIANRDNSSGDSYSLGGVMILCLTMVSYIYTKFMIWWNHG